jgi:hypothetical protein
LGVGAISTNVCRSFDVQSTSELCPRWKRPGRAKPEYDVSVGSEEQSDGIEQIAKAV